MRRKALVGVLVICVLVGAATMNGGAVTGESIKVPDRLPNGQKLVETAGEESIHENMGGLFPRYNRCKAYFYSDQTAIIICTFNSENEATGDLQNLVNNDPDVIPLSGYVEYLAKEADASEKEIRELLKSRGPSYLECDIPDLCVIREFDGILFPLGKNIIWISTEGEGALQLPEIAEAVYSLNTGASSTSTSTTATTPVPSSTPTSTSTTSGFESSCQTCEVEIKSITDRIIDGDKIEVTVNFTNIGTEDCHYAAQLYNRHSGLIKTEPFFWEWGPVFLWGPVTSKGETKSITLTSDVSDFPGSVPGQGEYSLKIDSEDTKGATCTFVYGSTQDRTFTLPSADASEKGIPGFEAMFVLSGLLTVAYLLRKHKQ